MTTTPFAPTSVNLHLQQLVYLRELEAAGTLTEAASRLGVSQSALSQSLSELERRLGVSLFERRGRRRELTEPGREVERFASEVLGRASELERWLRAYRDGDAGALRVGMIDAASLYILPRTIDAYRRAHPGVQLELLVDVSAALVERLERSDLDLVFAIGPLEDGFATTELLREPLYAYGPPGEDVPVAVEAAPEWALYPADSHTRQLIDEGFAARGIRPRVALESSNPEILRQMVALGLGWSVLPTAIAEAGPSPLVRRDPEPIAERTLLAARRAGAPSDARVDAFLALAAEGGS